MTNDSLEVLILCPTGQDASLIANVLQKEKIKAKALSSILEINNLNETDAGVLMIADESLNVESIESLNKILSEQEPWSDIPIILLTSGGARNQIKFKRLEDFITSGNVTLLERPFQPITLLSAAHVALKSRRRQYQVKSLLQSQLEATNIRDEFISIASHELKTPLTSLKLQTQMAKRQIQASVPFTLEKMQKQIDYTINQIDRLNKLVDDMLDVSRINVGKLAVQKSSFNLSLLLEDLIDRFKPQFDAIGIRIEVDIEPLVIGHWDAYKIEQVINNLFSNAIRYSPHKTVMIGLKKVNTEAVFNVKDEGTGIDPQNISRIFERFERATSSSSGLGLGLYITKQIIDLHQGKITVVSEIGKGSNFIITLPLSGT